MNPRLLFTFHLIVSSFLPIDLLGNFPSTDNGYEELTKNIEINKFDNNTAEHIQAKLPEESLPLLSSSDTSGVGVCQITKLLALDGTASGAFSGAVSIDGNIAAVGKYNSTIDETGYVYIFEKENGSWVQTAKFTADDANEEDYFGESLSLYGNTLLVGAQRADNSRWNSGAAYIFEKNENGWEQVAELTASDASYNHYFGIDVHLDEDVLIIGASNNGNGAAYVFEKPANGWTTMTETAKLVASDGVDNDNLGRSVSIHNNVAVAGAYNNKVNGVTTGSAYVYERPSGGWVNSTETAKLIASDGASSDFFGLEVDIDESTIIVSAYRKASFTGAAYIFERPTNGWVSTVENQKIQASNGSTYDYYGHGVSINNGSILIGAYEEGTNGVAYLYTKDNGVWKEFDSYTVTDGNTNKDFARSVSISGNSMILSAESDNENGAYAGAAYIFEKPSCDLSIEDIIIQDEICPGGSDNIITVIANCTNCVGGIEYSIDGIDFSNTSGILKI